MKFSSGARIVAAVSILVALVLAKTNSAGSAYPVQTQPDTAVAALAGLVNGDGTIIAGTKFKVKHNSTGNYTVSTPPFTKFPVMVVSATGVSGVQQVANVGTTSCNSKGCTFTVLMVTILNSADDSAFAFYIASST